MFLAVARLRSFSGAARELGVTTSSVSQAVKQLEATMRVVLLTRTTRNVLPTEAGQRLIERAGPALREALAALSEVSARPGETIGRVKLSVGRTAASHVIEPILPVFRDRHPRIEVEVVVDDRFVNIVAEGYDAGVRLTESIERDMVQIRLSDELRFVVVGAPSYLAKRGIPRTPEQLLQHECFTFRSSTTGALYAWELERGRRRWRVPVRGGVVSNETQLCVRLAVRGLGLAYTTESAVAEELRARKLQVVLDAYAPEVPGFFLYYPSRAHSSPALRLFVDVAKEVAGRTRKLA
jgi:DNA-binding transcriptional LysR family regulator